MWRNICQKAIIFGLVAILFTVCLTSVNSIEIKKSQSENTLSAECYYLGNALVKWGSPVHGFPFRPEIEFKLAKNYFNFTEENGTIKMCFWINFSHFLRHDIIIPRFSLFRLAIMDEDHTEEGFLYNKGFGWKKSELNVQSYNISIKSEDFFRDCKTNGEHMPGIIVFEVQGFPFGILPRTERYPVTFRPIIR